MTTSVTSNRRPPRLTDADVTRSVFCDFVIDGIDAGAFDLTPAQVPVIPVAPWTDYAAAYKAVYSRALHQIEVGMKLL